MKKMQDSLQVSAQHARFIPVLHMLSYYLTYPFQGHARELARGQSTLLRENSQLRMQLTSAEQEKGKLEQECERLLQARQQLAHDLSRVIDGAARPASLRLRSLRLLQPFIVRSLQQQGSFTPSGLENVLSGAIRLYQVLRESERTYEWVAHQLFGRLHTIRQTDPQLGAALFNAVIDAAQDMPPLDMEARVHYVYLAVTRREQVTINDGRIEIIANNSLTPLNHQKDTCRSHYLAATQRNLERFEHLDNTERKILDLLDLAYEGQWAVLLSRIDDYQGTLFTDPEARQKAERLQVYECEEDTRLTLFTKVPLDVRQEIERRKIQ